MSMLVVRDTFTYKLTIAHSACTHTAHKFALQAPVAPRGKKIFVICFMDLEYFAQRFNPPFEKNGKKN